MVFIFLSLKWNKTLLKTHNKWTLIYILLHPLAATMKFVFISNKICKSWIKKESQHLVVGLKQVFESVLISVSLCCWVVSSASGGCPGSLPVRAVHSLPGSSGDVLTLHQRGRNTGTCPETHRTQRSPHGETGTGYEDISVINFTADIWWCWRSVCVCVCSWLQRILWCRLRRQWKPEEKDWRPTWPSGITGSYLCVCRTCSLVMRNTNEQKHLRFLRTRHNSKHGKMDSCVE